MSREYTLKAFRSSDNAHKCALYTWLPDKKPYKAVVQILHGMREHMGRYTDFADFLTAQGFAVCGHDYLGHGKTVIDAADFGYFGEKDGCANLLADCCRATRVISAGFPGLPIFLLGHSMGSFLGRIQIARQSSRFSGFICMGTGGEVPAASAARVLLELSARRGAGRKTMKIFNQMVISPTMMRFNDEKEDFSWLSRDEAIGEAFASDRLSMHPFTNRALCDLVSLQMVATSKEWVKRVDKKIPILLLSGGRDVIGSMGKGVVQTYERLKLAGCLDVRCILYEEARHELLNEINKEEVYYNISSWISEHIEPREI